MGASKPSRTYIKAPVMLDDELQLALKPLEEQFTLNNLEHPLIVKDLRQDDRVDPGIILVLICTSVCPRRPTS